MEQKEEDKLSPSEAVYGMMGWLTSRNEVTKAMSSRHNATQAATLADEFCKVNNLSDPRDGWHKALIHPVGEVSTSNLSEETRQPRRKANCLQMSIYAGFWWPGSVNDDHKFIFGKIRKAVDYKERAFLGIDFRKFVDVREPYDTQALERIFFNFVVQMRELYSVGAEFKKCFIDEIQPITFDVIGSREIMCFTDAGHKVGSLEHSNDLLNRGVDPSSMDTVFDEEYVNLMFIPDTGEWLTYCPQLGDGKFKTFKKGDHLDPGEMGHASSNIYGNIVYDMACWDLDSFELVIPLQGGNNIYLDYAEFEEKYEAYVRWFNAEGDQNTVMDSEVRRFEIFIDEKHGQLTEIQIPTSDYVFRLYNKSDGNNALKLRVYVHDMRFTDEPNYAKNSADAKKMAIRYLEEIIKEAVCLPVI